MIDTWLETCGEEKDVCDECQLAKECQWAYDHLVDRLLN